MTDLAIAGGVAVGHLVVKGLYARKQRKHRPFQYLTKLVDAEREVLQMTFPLGLER
jgi:hypothetical protein